MNWTTDKPTQPGWYWWRTKDMGDMIIHVIERDGRLWEIDAEGLDDLPVDGDGEWAGPLEPPQ